jgi:hypothetical protein
MIFNTRWSKWAKNLSKVSLLGWRCGSSSRAPA